MSRRAFTLIETMFVMAVASIIILILLQMFTGVQRNVGRAEATLDFLRQATLLLDNVRRDIRSAGRGDSIQLGSTVTITREANSKDADAPPSTETVTYEFFETERYVKRTAKGGDEDREQSFGLSGRSVGFITSFQVFARNPRISVTTGNFTREIDVLGFYEIRLEFANQEQAKAMAEGKPGKSIHTFRTLVSKRAPEVRDDLWKPNPK